ncbi:MAG: hypothetical protein ACREC6_10125 [Hyphomicrobiaceae bacterium]
MAARLPHAVLRRGMLGLAFASLRHRPNLRLNHWEGRRLKLHPRKTVILPTAEPSQFLGFALAPGGGRRLPEDNIARFRGRLRGLRDRWRAGTTTREEADAKISAWHAHASHADTFRLRRAIFRGTRYEPWPDDV